MLDQYLLDRIVCPLDKQSLVAREDNSLQCSSCGRIYPIEDGIPILLVERSVVTP